MDIVLISNYWHFECEKSSSRYLTIANMLSNTNAQIEVITSSFYHATKKQREIKQSVYDSYKYKTTLINEPGYKKNIDIRRIISHSLFSKNVIAYLKKRQKPDLIYLFMPPTGLANSVVKFAKKNNIKIIVDILDLWPEAFNMVIPFPFVSQSLLYPMKVKAERVYKLADAIVAVSETYVERALKCCKNKKVGCAVYIGTDSIVFDNARNKNKNKLDDSFKIVYIGTLGTSYNLKCIMDAIKLMPTEVQKKTSFIIMGDGPKRADFENYAKQAGIRTQFFGKLPYETMVQYLCQCDIAVNPIVSSSASSIINKVADYAAAGLPVINTQQSNEYIMLLKKYNCGYCTNESDIQQIADYILELYNNKELRKQMGSNSRKLFEDKFDRCNSYNRILALVMSFFNKANLNN